MFNVIFTNAPKEYDHPANSKESFFLRGKCRLVNATFPITQMEDYNQAGYWATRDPNEATVYLENDPMVTPLEVGMVVQIDPEFDETFGGCLMTVTDPKSWGAQGYVLVPGQGPAYYRCEHKNMKVIGRRAEWELES